jgi:RNA polymerase sigma-70 factor (sigma-E family)
VSVLDVGLAGVVVEAGVSFDGYVRARSSGLIRLAWLITRDWDDARDAVQDAFAALYPRWSRLPADADRVEAYVSRCVVNACLAVIRRRGADPVADPALLDGAPVTNDGTAQVVEADRLWRLCGQLPPVQRAAVVLRFYRDLTFAEVANILGCGEATARSHVHRAVATLRLRMKEDGNQ